MFSRAKNVRISGKPRFVYNKKISSGSESLQEGIRLIASRVVKGAMHNSGERFDAPKCHEDTRSAIQDDILGWADELVEDVNELVTWMYGAAGAGKSAIAQTIAQKLHDRGQLTASFFFSRASDADGRSEETNFIATIAYQLSQSVPSTKPHIATAVQENPLVFNLTLQDQVDALIVAPLIAISNASSGFERPQVIVVDGLDECRPEKDAQRRVVDALISGLRRVPHHSHKLFITSRPEYHILSIFTKYEDVVRRMELDDKWNPDDDIRTFLNSSFADIRRSHFYFRKHPADRVWPRPEDIETLVERSSGQFIYASVILKYIKSEENYNPVARLETILELKNNGDQPYAELDALYLHIFSQIRYDKRVQVLTILHLDQEYRRIAIYTDLPKQTFLSEFIGVGEDEIEFCLLPLVSLLVWRDDGIRYIHASLTDFLCDQSRSNIFCINMPNFATGIVNRAIQLLEDVAALMKPDYMGLFIDILPHYIGKMQDYDEIYALVSHFNIVESVLRKINISSFEPWSNLLGSLAKYIRWVVKVSEDKNLSYSLKALLKPTAAQIETWTVSQFAQLDFNNLDNTEQIDVWPFFTAPEGWDHIDYPDSVEDVFQTLSSALEICRSSPSCHRLLRGTNFNLANQTIVLCFLLAPLAESPGNAWFERTDFLGCHAITAERYGTALKSVIYYLLQLPKDTLSEVLHVRYSKKNILSNPITYLIFLSLPTFFERSLWTTDLYFLMMLIRPVLRCFGIDSGFGITNNISNYTREVLEKFPFLKDSTSMDYKQAIQKAAEACVNRKIKTSLHELVDDMNLSRSMDEEELVAYKELLESFAVIDRRVYESD